MSTLRPFHLAFAVRDIAEARRFYGDLLGCTEGRSDDTWVDFDFFGHQVVTHLDPSLTRDDRTDAHHNPVDGKSVPVPHFGVVLKMADWRALRGRLIEAKVEFVIDPYIRFEGEPGEQATMFFLDPSGNALEFKAFEDLTSLFAK